MNFHLVVLSEELVNTELTDSPPLPLLTDSPLTAGQLLVWRALGEAGLVVLGVRPDQELRSCPVVWPE